LVDRRHKLEHGFTYPTITISLKKTYENEKRTSMFIYKLSASKGFIRPRHFLIYNLTGIKIFVDSVIIKTFIRKKKRNFIE